MYISIELIKFLFINLVYDILYLEEEEEEEREKKKQKEEES